MRVALIVALVLAIFGSLNAIAIAGLLRLHPRRRRFTVVVAVLCNLFWLLLPVVLAGQRLTWYSRVLRSVFGPPWFTWLLFIILYDALLIVLAIVWLLVARRKRFTAFARPVSRIFLIVLAAAAAYGYYTALVPVDVIRVPVHVAGLPPQFDGYRVAMMCDLHVGLFTRPWRLRQFASLVNRENPELVVLTGDLVDDDPWFVPKMVRGIDGIERSRMVVGVLGNHEMYGDPHEVIRRLRGSRINLLVNRGFELKRGGASIWVAGLSDFAASQTRRERDLLPDLPAALRGRPPGMPTLLLAHQGRAFDLAVPAHIPLTLAGHSHGGQVGFRRLGWTLAGLFIRYDMGLFRRGDSQLYVSTGTGYWLVPIRLGLPGEITLIELKR